jgi:hypothetical protein
MSDAPKDGTPVRLHPHDGGAFVGRLPGAVIHTDGWSGYFGLTALNLPAACSPRTHPRSRPATMPLLRSLAAEAGRAERVTQ